ncbi:hypothetical protein EJ02DRAFT_450814 [Clathrospora elynae]|uniref:Uncharacterized protein n=1 Tax=Clathrospora elynae TaxID=706981 RepID=A0A6A5T1F0_9PLEO|nr:hypothetical protein EJ02DRAFT_450814 [Clathrospora elynae]
MALPIQPRARGGERPGNAISTSTLTPTDRCAASMALQTQIWESEVKDGLALPPLPPLPHTNDSYP